MKTNMVTVKTPKSTSYKNHQIEPFIVYVLDEYHYFKTASENMSRERFRTGSWRKDLKRK